MVSIEFANFIAKNGWPANFLDLNPIEDIWSIINEITFKDPAPKTMKELKRRLRFAWKNVTLAGHAKGTRTFYALALRKCH